MLGVHSGGCIGDITLHEVWKVRVTRTKIPSVCTETWSSAEDLGLRSFHTALSVLHRMRDDEHSPILRPQWKLVCSSEPHASQSCVSRLPPL